MLVFEGCVTEAFQDEAKHTATPEKKLKLRTNFKESIVP
jgi:hypothetical protein